MSETNKDFAYPNENFYDSFRLLDLIKVHIHASRTCYKESDSATTYTHRGHAVRKVAVHTHHRFFLLLRERDKAARPPTHVLTKGRFWKYASVAVDKEAMFHIYVLNWCI
jgi:hypothetical protein